MDSKRISSKAFKAAWALSHRFFGFDPRKVSSITIGQPKALAMLGTCTQVNYCCDKYDGEPREYWHRFNGPVILLAVPERLKDGSRMLIVMGDFDIDEDGIKG